MKYSPLSIAFVLGLLIHLAVSETITLGVSLTLPTPQTPPNSQRAALGKRIYDGMMFWKETARDVFGPISIGNTNYTLDLRIVEDYDNISIMTNNYLEMINDSSVDFLIAPVNSDWSNMISATVTEKAERLLVATSAGANSFFAGGEWSFSVLTPSKAAFSSTLPLLKFKGAKTIAFISEDHPYASEACSGLTDGMAADVGMTVLDADYQHPLIPFAPIPKLSEYNLELINSEVDRVIPLNPDVLIVCSFPNNGFEIVRALKKRNYSPKAIVVTPLLIEWESFEDKEYLNGHDQWITTAAFPADPWYGTSADYSRNFKRRFEYEPDGFNAFGSVVPVVYDQALRRTKSLSQEDVKFSLSR